MPTPEQERAQLQQLLELRELIDTQLEQDLSAQEDLSHLAGHLLPALRAFFSAEGAFLYTANEEMTLTLFSSPEGLPTAPLQEALTQTGPEQRSALTQEVKGQLWLASPLDIVGEWVGSFGLVLPKESPLAQDKEHLSRCVRMVCEELDNYLVSMHQARKKHATLAILNQELQHLVLHEGLKNAAAVLTRAIPTQKLFLVYRADEKDSPPHMHLFEDGALKIDSDDEGMPTEQKSAMLRSARRYLDGKSQAILEELGLTGPHREVVISGMTHQVVLARIVVSAKSGLLRAYDRDLLESFAGLLRHRLVDFGKEWRKLAEAFCERDVNQLLASRSYASKYLAPHEAEVALVYADIAGFTRISEQILRSPSAVSSLVEAWSREAVKLVWEHGGVFDKMVGDCIIAIFGPPFYREPPEERLQTAIRCAQSIRDMTKGFAIQPPFDALKLPELGVAIGVNLAPVMVGYFGPNSNFTCFSSGMNNTARLQGCATKHEILVMEEAVARLPQEHSFSFSEERQAVVKNVASPLRFRALLG